MAAIDNKTVIAWPSYVSLTLVFMRKIKEKKDRVKQGLNEFFSGTSGTPRSPSQNASQDMATSNVPTAPQSGALLPFI